MRYAARRDENELEIIQALRRLGWGVQSIDASGFPDLVVAKGKRIYLMEVIGSAKAAKYRKTQGLTPPQVKFHASWPGEIHLVHSIEEALAIVRWDREDARRPTRKSAC